MQNRVSRAKTSITVSVAVALGLGCTLEVSAKPLPIPNVDTVYPFVPDWRVSRILHFGDSHVSSGLKASLARHFRQAGAQFHQERWVGSRSKSWVASGRLRHLIAAFRPNVVLITLGTNEMRSKTPSRSAAWIHEIVNGLNGAVCYWMGPPPLIEDKNGYNEMAKKAVKPCRYFDSRTLNMKPRSSGSFHLTRSQGTVWGDRVWHWMNGD
jgi:hypothetical protein